MAISLVNSLTAQYAGSAAETSHTVTLTNAATAGSTLLIACGWNTSNDTLLSVVDSKGNPYSIDVQLQHAGGGGESCALVSGRLEYGLSTSDTLTMNITNAGSATLLLHATEWAGIGGSPRVDQVASQFLTNTNPGSSGTSAALAGSDELAIGVNIQSSSSTTVGSGYTSLVMNLANTGSFIRYLSMEYKLNATQTGEAATFGNSGTTNTVTLLGTYKAFVPPTSTAGSTRFPRTPYAV